MDKDTGDLTTIDNDEETVARGVLVDWPTLKNIKGLPEDVEVELYYFASVKLSPMVAFKHLAGAPLGSFLDQCSITLPDFRKVGPLMYVHGRSEVMRGKHYTSLVLLARQSAGEPVSSAVWKAAVPEIYRRFTAGSLSDGKSEKA